MDSFDKRAVTGFRWYPCAVGTWSMSGGQEPSLVPSRSQRQRDRGAALKSKNVEFHDYMLCVYGLRKLRGPGRSPRLRDGAHASPQSLAASARLGSGEKVNELVWCMQCFCVVDVQTLYVVGGHVVRVSGFATDRGYVENPQATLRCAYTSLCLSSRWQVLCVSWDRALDDVVGRWTTGQCSAFQCTQAGHLYQNLKPVQWFGL